MRANGASAESINNEVRFVVRDIFFRTNVPAKCIAIGFDFGFFPFLSLSLSLSHSLFSFFFYIPAVSVWHSVMDTTRRRANFVDLCNCDFAR